MMRQILFAITLLILVPLSAAGLRELFSPLRPEEAVPEAVPAIVPHAETNALVQQLAETQRMLEAVQGTATASVLERQLVEAVSTLAVMQQTATAIAVTSAATADAGDLTDVTNKPTPAPPMSMKIADLMAAARTNDNAPALDGLPGTSDSRPLASDMGLPSPATLGNPTTTSIARIPLTIVRASSELACSKDGGQNLVCYPAGNAIDRDESTAWRESMALHPWLEVDLPDPMVVTQIEILGGYAKVDPYDGSDRWLENHRPRHVRVILNGVEAGIYKLTDSRAWQTIDLIPQKAQRIRLAIVDSYPPQEGQRPYVAISEFRVLGHKP